MYDDTICAPASAPVNSSIAIIRISGSESERAVNSIFSNSKKIKDRTAIYGSIIDNKEIVDDVILTYYRSPKSFTGEDMVDIYCHGNQIIVSKIIQMLNKLGIRMAQPGEFCKRSFLNGKIDLTEAEAINHVITAQSEWEISTALKQMHGSLKNIINEFKENIILLKANIEARIDFIEEDIEFVSNNEALNQINDIHQTLENLLRRCKLGAKISHGIDVIITGKPNVGKSSILNLMLNQERAIVSNIPGTTRDLIKESIQINGLLINLFDSAGINNPTNEIEKIGVELSHKKIESASIVIMVLDATTGICSEDIEIIKNISGKKHITLLNKVDLLDKNNSDSLKNNNDLKTLSFSAKTGEGLKELEREISNILKNDYVDYESSFVADLRIIDLLGKSLDNVNKTHSLISNNEPAEITAFELQALIDNLSEITGEITPDDVLDSIFSRFCIGK